MKFHHIGFIVADLIWFEKSLIFETKYREVFDPLQHAQLALYGNFSNSYIELIQPLDSEAFTWNFIQKNGKSGFHHFCYEVKNLSELEMIKREYRLIPILEPIPAVLFEGKQVAFFYSRNKLIVEFLILENESSVNI